ncbi:hypothetical protein PybrP1_012941 [[Pythium] brassicae (nom. inval.)]|nr:hypothetical protein PybrP1_012941 [[Pythium] brassicae (nom. inval.)]
MAGERTSFCVVFVPVDENRALEEWQVALPADKEAQLGCLTERLRAHFKQGGSTGHSDAEQREIFKQQLMSQLPAGASLSEDMLQMMLGMDSLVDSFPLVVNTRAENHVGVNMYVDDKGTAKGLPTNRRASAIAQACGRMIEVRGDAFIARIFDNDDDFERLDFRLSEVTMDAEWVLIGKRQSIASAGGASPSAAPSAPARALPSAVHVCAAAMCSANGTLRCSRCKAQHYCSAKCQKLDWKTHKLSCKKS